MIDLLSGLRLTVFLCLLLVGPLARANAPNESRGDAPLRQEVELRYELRVRIRSLRIDADLWSGGRLVMAADPNGSDGTTTLRLVRVLEHPWKLWWVSPLVGFGELKYAEEIALDSGTWASRMRAESATQSRGRLRWEQWRREWGGNADLDQSFAFYIIGSPRGRWRTLLGPTGEIQTVVNRLTHRWLPNGFTDWLAGNPREGYGFWADDPEPPAWEPHAYHAFAEALRLLSVSAIPASGWTPIDGARWEVRHRELVSGARQVLETLAPATRGRVPGSGDALFQYVVEEGEGGRFVIRGDTGPSLVEGSGGMLKGDLELHAERVLEWAPSARPLAGSVVADDLRVMIGRGEQVSLEIRVSRSLVD